jgi:hypothetical protein
MTSTRITPADVIAAFRRETGHPVQRRPQISSISGRIVPLVPSAPLKEMFGRFQLGVFESVNATENARPPIKPTPEGIYWEEQYPLDEREAPYWSARKFYGNVQLIWWADVRAIDGRWKRLDRILSDLAPQGA